MEIQFKIKKEAMRNIPERTVKTDNPEILAAYCIMHALCGGDDRKTRECLRSAVMSAQYAGLAKVEVAKIEVAN